MTQDCSSKTPDQSRAQAYYYQPEAATPEVGFAAIAADLSDVVDSR